MLTMEDELIQVFVEVDDLLKEMGHRSHHHAKLSDSEVITIASMKELWHLKTDKASLRLIKEKFGSFFPSIVWLQPLAKTVQTVGCFDERIESKISQ